MTDALSKVRTRNTVTPQTEKVLGRDDQVKNNAGGWVFEVAGEDRIRRFLTLGTDGGTYYQKEREYTAENAAVVIDWAKNHGADLTQLVLNISVSGRAPRQNPALFALAAVFAFGSDNDKRYASTVFNDIVRTGTHLFTFVGYTEQLRGWGRSVKRAVASWYTSRSPRDLSYQMVKYRQRENWTHADVLRSAHPAPKDPEQNALFKWATHRSDQAHVLPAGTWVQPYEAAQALAQAGAKGSAYANLIREYPGLPWEALPDVALTYPETWEALLAAGMPITALIRQLPRLTNLGLTKDSTLAQITGQLTSEDKLRKGRVHPVQLLYALKTYALGHGIKGSNTWTPVQRVVDALDAAFYASFGTIEPTGKRTLLAVDLSDSMTWPESKCGVLTAREGAAAMAMATAAVESDYTITGFSAGPGATLYCNSLYGSSYAAGIEALAISPRRRLDDNLRTIESSYAGGTDCALPMMYARDKSLEIDTFIIYTDNETHSGTIHPFEALRQYRQASGIDAKLIVAGMSSTGFTIADPKDPGTLDVAGFDADTPNIISGFSRGDFS